MSGGIWGFTLFYFISDLSKRGCHGGRQPHSPQKMGVRYFIYITTENKYKVRIIFFVVVVKV